MLSDEEVLVLQCVREQREVSAFTAARLAGISRQQATALLARLHQRGVLARARERGAATSLGTPADFRWVYFVPRESA